MPAGQDELEQGGCQVGQEGVEVSDQAMAECRVTERSRPAPTHHYLGKISSSLFTL